MSNIYNIEDELKDVRDCKPHVVILGAGASVAALPCGDKNSKILPTMENFVEVLELQNIIPGHLLIKKNFEEIYSSLERNGKYEKIRLILEEKVHEYFSSLILPEEPNLYDHLILSLRRKDRIFTFNWDPFLIQAYRRNSKLTRDLPSFTFLHGNVMVGACLDHYSRGTLNNKCKVCGKPFAPSKLLYPIKNKDYNSDSFIKYEWEIFDDALNNAAYITLFGYSAPTSDIVAIEKMKEGWNKDSNRVMEQVEIIDILNEDNIYSRWEDFIHSDHFDVFDSFYDSWIANHPRRSIEAYYNQYWEIKFLENNPIPVGGDFKELYNFFKTILEHEGNIQNLT